MTETCRFNARRALAAVLLCGAALALPTGASALDTSGRVSASTIYSDNIFLAPNGLEEGGVIFYVDPSILLASTGRRYDFRLDYTLQALYYVNQSDSTSVYNLGVTTLDIEILDEHLFLNSLASLSQVVVDPKQAFSLGNIPQPNNLSDALIYGTGPEWKQDIFGTKLDIHYDLRRVNYKADDLQDSDFQGLFTDWTGPEKDHGLTWAFHHEYQKYTFEASPDAKLQLAEVSLILQLSGGWAPFVSAGMENDVRNRTDGALQDGIWRAGLRRRTVRTTFEAFVGERSFGSSWGASFERHYGANSGNILRIAYSEIPSTSDDFGSERTQPPTNSGGTPPPPPGPVLPPPVLPPGTVAPGSGRLYLLKTGDFLLAHAFNRNSVSGRLYYEEDESLADSATTGVGTTKQAGVLLAWSHQLGARTSALLETSGVKREFPGSTSANTDRVRDNLLRVRTGLSYQLGPRTSLSGWIAREQRRESTGQTFNYTENQVGLSVGRTF